MKKTKFTIIALLAMVGVIGFAFATFAFNNTETEKGLGFELADYTDAGSIAFTDLTSDPLVFELDNATEMQSKSISFSIQHIPETEPGKVPAGTPTGTLTYSIQNPALAAYITVTLDATAVDNWKATPGTKTAITITVSWKTDKEPENVAAWNALNAILADESSTVLIVAEVTYS